MPWVSLAPGETRRGYRFPRVGVIDDYGLSYAGKPGLLPENQVVVIVVPYSRTTPSDFMKDESGGKEESNVRGICDFIPYPIHEVGYVSYPCQSP